MCMYGSSQVMSVTGHNSMQSLSVYQRVSDAGKHLDERILFLHSVWKQQPAQNQLLVSNKSYQRVKLNSFFQILTQKKAIETYAICQMHI